jgi:2-polyprenyl-6-hydroxyphenyl methylase / 3-demethylubiquinone-9 3-methyltransferase
LHGSITPGRFAYFRDVLTRNAEVRGLRALDLGCGGGFSPGWR